MAADDLLDDAADQIAAALKSPEMLNACFELAKLAATYSIGIAPVHTGDYIESISAQRDAEGAFVLYADPFAHIIEYGNAVTPEYAVRQRTEDAFNNGDMVTWLLS